MLSRSCCDALLGVSQRGWEKRGEEIGKGVCGNMGMRGLRQGELVREGK